MPRTKKYEGPPLHREHRQALAEDFVAFALEASGPLASSKVIKAELKKAAKSWVEKPEAPPKLTRKQQRLVAEVESFLAFLPSGIFLATDNGSTYIEDTGYLDDDKARKLIEDWARAVGKDG